MALNNEWTEEDWQALVSVIRKGKCILVLGPETAVEEMDGNQQLLCRSLANLLAQDIEPHIRENIDTSNLMETAQYYSFKQGKTYLHNKIRDFYKQRHTLSSSFHRDLAALPFYLALNASPDEMFHAALTEQNKKPGTGWYNFKNKKSVMQSIGTPGEPMIFYLYGNVRDEDSLVVTENDLLDFLVSIVSVDTLPDRLVNELKAPDKSFLFLGFGFKHWYLRIILHILEVKKKDNPSLALEDFTPHSVDELKSTVLFYREGPYKIHFFENRFDEFAKELRKRYEETEGPEGHAGAAAGAVPYGREGRPKVFICHANENKSYAASLYKKLEAEGLEPWLDRENLRGGDRWDKEIERAIHKEIDYFLVLQSNALGKRAEGYVYKEIHEALERQKKFSYGMRFIIPLRFEDCCPLGELEHLQTMDLDTEDKTGDLVRLIKRDYAKRGRG